jgi:DNA polymerase III delta prime subunit
MSILDTHKQSSDWGLKYRPDNINDIILPGRFMKQFRKVIEENSMCNYLFSGDPGCGKTTLALILAKELDYDLLYINMSRDTSIEVLRTDIQSFGMTVSSTGRRKMVIADECEKASGLLKDGLKAEIERLSENVSFIFISNHANQLPEALHSRLQKIDFVFTPDEVKEMKTEIYKRLIQILDFNKCDYEKPAIQILVNKFFPDFRKILNRTQCLSYQGPITKAIVENSITVNLKEFFDILERKKYKELRQYIANLNVAPQHFYSEVFKEIDQHFEKGKLCQAIISLSKFSYESAFVADAELNLCACALELMML